MDYFFLAVVVLELLRNFDHTTPVMRVYALGATSLILSDAVFLSALAYIVYVRPTEAHFKDTLKAILGPRLWPHGLLLFSFAAYIVYVMSYLFVYEPFRVVTLKNLAGFRVASALFDSNFLLLLSPVVAVFLAYPCTQLFLAARKSTDESVRRSLRILTLGWIAIALALLIFNGYLLTLGYDSSAFGYLIVVTAFSTSAAVFRRASILEEFFQPLKVTVPVTNHFSRRIGIKGPSIQGKVMLLEVDSSTSYGTHLVFDSSGLKVVR